MDLIFNFCDMPEGEDMLDVQNETMAGRPRVQCVLNCKESRIMEGRGRGDMKGMMRARVS